jgi:hypothetical protein
MYYIYDKTEKTVVLKGESILSFENVESAQTTALSMVINDKKNGADLYNTRYQVVTPFYWLCRRVELLAESLGTSSGFNIFDEFICFTFLTNLPNAYIDWLDILSELRNINDAFIVGVSKGDYTTFYVKREEI